MKVAYIGGGAASLFSAFYLSKNCNFDITIYEKRPKSGAKINGSGNGRGNLSNLNVAPNKYNNPKFVEPFLAAFTPRDLQTLLLKYGLLTVADEEGRIYPYGDSAQIFTNFLLRKLEERHVKFINNVEVTSITKKDQFIINGKDQYDKVIIATGSNAGLSPNLSSTAILDVLHYFDIHSTDLHPTLSSIGVLEPIEKVNGRRAKANIKLVVEEKEVYRTSGEVQFRKDALSGIAIFECSSILTWLYRKNKKISAQIYLDLMPEYSIEEIIKLITVNKQVNLDGIFYPTISEYLIKTAGPKASGKEVAHLIKEVPFNVNFDYVPDNNQVNSGGIRLNEVDPLTLESKKVKDLYFAGEILDIDGLCGGYNLHFAFASGVAVAKAIIND